MFTAGEPLPGTHYRHHLFANGVFLYLCRAHIRIRLLHMGSPHLRTQRHPLRKSFWIDTHSPFLVETYPFPVSGGRCVCSQTDVRTLCLYLMVPLPDRHLVPQPPDYPLSPFKMRFEPPLFHPNSKQVKLSPSALRLASLCPSSRADRLFPVYPDGNVCISILHTPGEDPLMYEQASERWSPVQSVEKVLLSVISMLAGKVSLPIFGI